MPAFPAPSPSLVPERGRKALSYIQLSCQPCLCSVQEPPPAALRADGRDSRGAQSTLHLPCSSPCMQGVAHTWSSPAEMHQTKSLSEGTVYTRHGFSGSAEGGLSPGARSLQLGAGPLQGTRLVPQATWPYTRGTWNCRNSVSFATALAR